MGVNGGVRLSFIKKREVSKRVTTDGESSVMTSGSPWTVSGTSGRNTTPRNIMFTLVTVAHKRWSTQAGYSNVRFFSAKLPSPLGESLLFDFYSKYTSLERNQSFVVCRKLSLLAAILTPREVPQIVAAVTLLETILVSIQHFHWHYIFSEVKGSGTEDGVIIRK